MLSIRAEELQISWACSAQNPELLPESVKRQKTNSLKEHAGRYFNGS